MRDTFFFFFFFRITAIILRGRGISIWNGIWEAKLPWSTLPQSVPTLDGKWITKQNWAIWETGRVSLIAEQGQIYTPTLLLDQVFQSWVRAVTPMHPHMTFPDGYLVFCTAPPLCIQCLFIFSPIFRSLSLFQFKTTTLMRYETKTSKHIKLIFKNWFCLEL